MNLLEETQDILKQNNKSLINIRWFGTRSSFITGVSIQKFLNVNYDAGFGGHEIPENLILVGDDFWLERHEYDGSEWWEFKTLPTKPECESVVSKLDPDTYGGWAKYE